MVFQYVAGNFDVLVYGVYFYIIKKKYIVLVSCICN